MHCSLLLVGMLLALHVPPATTGIATATVDEVRNQLLVQADRLWAWSIEYHGDATERTPETRRHVASRSPGDLYVLTRKSAPLFNWGDDPFQTELFVTSEEIVSHYPASRVFRRRSSTPDEPIPGGAARELLIGALGWWASSSRPAPRWLDDQPLVLRDVAESARYQLRTGPEWIDERPYLVLENPGYDRLWIDWEGGGVLRRRELLDSGRLVERVDLLDYREIGPGIWVPHEIRRTSVEGSGDDGTTPSYFHSRIQVVRAAVNEQVPDSIFRFTALPGSIEISSDDTWLLAAPGGHDHLEFAADWVRRHLGTANDEPSRLRWVVGLEYAAIAAASLALALCAGRRLYRR